MECGPSPPPAVPAVPGTAIAPILLGSVPSGVTASDSTAINILISHVAPDFNGLLCNPQTIVKILGIFRTFYNYCLAGQDGKTPAMRLGLAKGKVALEDVIYFV
jgi:hypothetical protein